MHDLDALLFFDSPSFPRHQRDEELANSEFMHGYKLSRHIADDLEKRGFGTVDLVAEDWGWHCGVENEGYDLMYGVCNENDSGFLIQFNPSKPVIRRWFTKIHVEPKVRALQTAVFEILQTDPSRTTGPRWED